MPPDTDIFNDGFDALVSKLGTITGLPVVYNSDPRNINPPCVLVEAPTFVMQSNVIAELQFKSKTRVCKFKPVPI